MRKLGHSESDSLELLLDTVCSMFGAILLIAILVALMAKTTTETSAGDQASTEITERRIDIAQRDLNESLKLLESLEVAKDDQSGALLSEKNLLEQAIAAEKAKSERAGVNSKEMAMRLSVDPGVQIKELSDTLKSAQEQQAALSNKLEAQNTQTSSVQTRIAEISTLLKEEQDARNMQLRFPKERTQTKEQRIIFCKFGKLYFWDRSSGAVKLTPLNKDSVLVELVASNGLDIKTQRREIQSGLSDISKDRCYVAFYVYPDSFETYQWIRDTILKSGLEFGVSFKKSSDELIFSEGAGLPSL
jgi:hypothetical protein